MMTQRFCRTRATLSKILITLLYCLYSTSLATAGECRVVSFSLNGISPVFDGNWQGIATASDGACYFAASTHSPTRGAGFFRFHPDDHEFSVLANDITVVCGYDPEETTPQGKIHSPLVEHDGWIYFTTHLANYWDQAQDTYPGSHVLGYEMATGNFRDFGVVRPRFTIYSSIQVDPVHNQLYVIVVPMARDDVAEDGTYLYRIDIASGNRENLGKIVSGRASNLWFYVDAAGNCWFTMWRAPGRTKEYSGHLYRVNARDASIHYYKNVLPKGLLAPDGEPVTSNSWRNRYWTWVQGWRDNKRAVFTMGRAGGGDERLWLFDPSLDIKTGEAFIPLGFIGSTFLSVALGGDRVYFVQYRELDDARRHSPEHMRDRESARERFPAELHLRSMSIAEGADAEIVDHGRIVDQDGRVPLMIESLAADENGRVYMVGSWTIRPGDEPTMQYVWEGQRFWPDAEPGTYQIMNRGEFFAYVDPGKDQGH